MIAGEALAEAGRLTFFELRDRSLQHGRAAVDEVEPLLRSSREVLQVDAREGVLRAPIVLRRRVRPRIPCLFPRALFSRCLLRPCPFARSLRDHGTRREGREHHDEGMKFHCLDAMSSRELSTEGCTSARARGVRAVLRTLSRRIPLGRSDAARRGTATPRGTRSDEPLTVRHHTFWLCSSRPSSR